MTLQALPLPALQEDSVRGVFNFRSSSTTRVHPWNPLAQHPCQSTSARSHRHWEGFNLTASTFVVRGHAQGANSSKTCEEGYMESARCEVCWPGCRQAGVHGAAEAPCWSRSPSPNDPSAFSCQSGALISHSCDLSRLCLYSHQSASSCRADGQPPMHTCCQEVPGCAGVGGPGRHFASRAACSSRKALTAAPGFLLHLGDQPHCSPGRLKFVFKIPFSKKKWLWLHFPARI